MGRLGEFWWRVEKTWVVGGGGALGWVSRWVEEPEPPPGVVYIQGVGAPGGGAAAAQPRVKFLTKCSRMRGFTVSNAFKLMIISF